MEFENKFPENLEDTSYVYGAFVKDNNNVPKISFSREGRGLRPIGGTLRLQDMKWLDSSLYIQELTSLLQGLRNNSKELFYNEGQQEKIIANEISRDRDRGEHAPYFRVVVYNWLRKTGLYPLHMVYVGHIKGQANSLTKHLFYVRECLTFTKNNPMYMSSYSHDAYQFDNNFARECYVSMYNLPYVTKNIYQGKFLAYSRLLGELINFYGESKSPKKQEQLQNQLNPQ